MRAFGSRVGKTAKNYSDLDLAAACREGLGLDPLRRLKEAFEQSDLPFRVDVIDWHSLAPGIRKVIEERYEVMQKQKSGVVA